MSECVCSSPGSGVEKPIGEAVLQIDMIPGKERKVAIRGEKPERFLRFEGPLFKMKDLKENRSESKCFSEVLLTR